MQIRTADTNLQSSFKLYLGVSALTFAGFWTGLGASAFIGFTRPNANLSYLLMPLFFVWIIYIIVSFFTNASAYLRNMVVLPKVFENIQKAIQSPPEVSFHMRCWHNEERIVESTDSEGNTTTRVETIQVTTHEAYQDWEVRSWSDSSPPASTLHYLDVLKMARLRTHKNFFYTPTAVMRKRHDESEFIARESRDEHNDFHCASDVPY